MPSARGAGLHLESRDEEVGDVEAGLRDDLARQLLQAAVVGGMNTPQALTDTLYAYQAETRAFTVLQLTQSSLPEKLAEPTEPDLQTFYTAHIADFTRPEAKRVAYALLKPSDLAKDQIVAEADIKAGEIVTDGSALGKVANQASHPNLTAAEYDAWKVRIDGDDPN